MIINKSGITIRLKVAAVRIMGRATQGVRLINLEKRNDHISSVCKVQTQVNEEEDEELMLGQMEGAEGNETPEIDNPKEDTKE